MRLMVAIDVSLWHQLRSKEAVTGWLFANNDHPLFAGKPAIELLLSGKPSVMKVVYTYLRNTAA